MKVTIIQQAQVGGQQLSTTAQSERHFQDDNEPCRGFQKQRWSCGRKSPARAVMHIDLERDCSLANMTSNTGKSDKPILMLVHCNADERSSYQITIIREFKASLI